MADAGENPAAIYDRAPREARVQRLAEELLERAAARRGDSGGRVTGFAMNPALPADFPHAAELVEPWTATVAVSLGPQAPGRYTIVLLGACGLRLAACGSRLGYRSVVAPRARMMIATPARVRAIEPTAGA